MRKYIVIILFSLIIFPIKASTSDSLQVSLLTVKPRPDKVYTLYGHSALRLYHPQKGLDHVFNWGTFDSSDPFFIYRFIKGDTDYFLSLSSYREFLYQYSLSNATVIEQIIDLSPEEKEKLFQLVSSNLLEENIVYRYNYFFDNCTTRIRDLVENATNHSVIYPEQKEKVTFRDLIHSCTDPYPWMTFGIDLLIGSGADSLIHQRQELFLPMNLKDAFDNSYIIDPNEGSKRNLVLSSQTIMQSVPKENEKDFLGDSPLVIGILVLLFYTGVILFGLFRRREYRGAFPILFLVAGCAGIIIVFLLLLSDHPCVSPNWNILWLHPFHCIGFAGYFFKKSYSLISLYHSVNLLLLCILLISWHWLPQTLNTANIPYILCLGMVSAFWLINKKRKRNE